MFRTRSVHDLSWGSYAQRVEVMDRDTGHLSETVICIRGDGDRSVYLNADESRRLLDILVHAFPQDALRLMHKLQKALPLDAMAAINDEESKL
ncbi:MAG: hypothetical protein AB7L09_02705 [Nitrospira sp.]